MTDRELLELAAKAAGMPWDRWVEDGDASWNPLEDDGDALRLAVKLRIAIAFDWEYVGGPVVESVIATAPADKGGVVTYSTDCLNYQNTDEMEVTRRAIVRVAAEIQLAKDASDDSR